MEISLTPLNRKWSAWHPRNTYVRLVYKEYPAKPVGNYNVKVRDIVMVPRSAFSGNDMILITKNGLKYMDNAILEGLECGIKNIFG
jgi:hypothetical protein